MLTSMTFSGPPESSCFREIKVDLEVGDHVSSVTLQLWRLVDQETNDLRSLLSNDLELDFGSVVESCAFGYEEEQGVVIGVSASTTLD
jgi:hypothetical protein